MCGCKCVIEGKGVVNSWHHGLSLSLSLCPRRTWQRVLKLEDRHDITHALIYTISSIFNWRIWFAERQTWVNERENERPGVPFLSPGVTLEITPLLSLWFRSERDTRQKERREREREKERNSTLRYQAFPWTWTSELALFLSLSNVFALFLSLSTHTRRTRIHREEIIEIHRETWRREGGRERER